MADLNLLDFLALAILLVSVIAAVLKGFVTELVSLGSVVAGVFLAIFLYPGASALLSGLGLPGMISDFLGFLALFLLSILGGAILARLIGVVLKAAHLRWIDRILGGVFGLIRGWLINLAVFLALTVLPVGGDWVVNSRLAEFFLTSARALTLVSPGEFEERFRQSHQRIYEIWLEQTRQDDAASEDQTDHQRRARGSDR